MPEITGEALGGETPALCVSRQPKETRAQVSPGLLWLALLLGAAAGVRDAVAQQSRIESSDLYRLRSVGDVQLSPDGSRIAYTVENRDRPGRPYSQIWILNLETGQSTRVGSDDAAASNPRWSPDGRRIAYLGRAGDRFGLMLTTADGSGGTFLAPVQGTNHPLPSMGEQFAWSPNGRLIAFASATPGPETQSAGGDPIVITRYLYKPTASEGSTRFDDNRRLHLFVVDVGTADVRQVTHGTFYEHSVDWSPDGEEILFVSNRERDPDRFFNYDLFTVRLSDGSVRQLTFTESSEYRPRWSPDGGTIAFEGTRRGLTSSETTMEDTHVWLMNADGTGRRELGAMIDNRQNSPEWSPDRSMVYFTVQERGNVRLYRLPAAGGGPEVVVGGPGSVGDWSTARGDLIAYAQQTPSDLWQLSVVDGRSVRRLSDLNQEALRGKSVAGVEAFRFYSFDGMEVEAFLTIPPHRTAGSRHPLIVMVKGGPHSQQGPAFNHKAQVYAARGWAALMVNYRGSTGYGQKFADAIYGDQNGGEAKDVLYGVETALRRYAWLDPDRVAIEGGSYGGQLANWLVTQTDRFKAAIPAAGISNLISFNYMAYYHDYLAVEFGAFPHQGDLMDLLWERSALKHVAKVRTPVMLVHGENDNDVPIAEAEQYYIALKDVGVETILIRYPREGHGLRETKHVVDLIDRSITWYERHFSSTTTTTSERPRQ